MHPARALFAVAVVPALLAGLESGASAFTEAQLANLANANQGGMACKTNSLGGSSFGSSCTGNGGYPEYWCADFVKWVWENSGVQYASELTAAAGSFYVYGQNHGTLHQTPHVGDAVVFNYQGGGVADHVAIVTVVNADGSIESQSGDWGGQSGSEATFASTSHVVLNAPAYSSTVGGTPGVIGMSISGFISPVGLATEYAATYVAQSFPLASSALTIVEGQSIPSWIELKNTGTKTWDSNTRIATTQPRNRSSIFVGADWISPSRLAAVKGTVPPGSSYKFPFELHAPNKPGTYYEYFGVVEEGVAWFGDPSQGGPPDDNLEVQIKVVTPEYRGEFKAQSFPVAPAAITAHQGDVIDGYIEVTNTGTQPWKAGVTKLAPTPRDKASAFADKSWLSPTRVSTVAADVAPGAVGRFPVKLDATQVGNFNLTFGLIEEGVTWFSDFPAGGGPADGTLHVQLNVESPVPGAPGAPGADGGVAYGDGGVSPGDGGSDPTNAADATGNSGGCSVTVARSDAGSSMALALGVMSGLVIVRRRRSR